MFKEWGLGDRVNSPMTGEENYNTIEANEGKDPVNPHTFNRVFGNLLYNDEQFNTLICALNKNKNTFNGVIKNVGDNFFVDENNFIIKEIRSTTYNIFLSPKGFGIKDGKCYYITDNLRLAERQLADALKIDDIAKNESVTISVNKAENLSVDFEAGITITKGDIIKNLSTYYEYSGSEDIVVEPEQTIYDISNLITINPDDEYYTCEVNKYAINNFGNLEIFYSRFRGTNSFDLLINISDKFPNYIFSYFVDNEDHFHPEYFKLREILIIDETIFGNNQRYYFGIKDDKVVISDNENELDFVYCSSKLTNNGTKINLVNLHDKREFIPLSESLQNNVFLNVNNSTTDETDLTTVTNPLYDDTLDYSKIENNPSAIVTLRKVGEEGEETSSNAVFAFTNDQTISDYDENAKLSNVKDVYLVNKDIYIYVGQEEGQNVYMSLKNAASSTGGIETKLTYQQLIHDYDHVDNEADFEAIKPIFLVIENNTIYAKKGERLQDDSYNVYWYPVEDPYVQPYKKEQVYDGTITSPVPIITFKEWFNELNLESDGRNFMLFDQDGNYVPFTIDSNSGDVVFNDTDITSLRCVVFKGGEQYAAAYTVLQAGTQEGSNEVYYSGSLRLFRIKTTLLALPNKINVYVNGAIKNEAVPICEGTITDVSDNTLTISSVAGLSAENYYLYDKNNQSIYTAEYSSGNTIDVSSYDGSDITDINDDDSYIILNKNIYDYFVDDASNSIVFFDKLNTGDIVRAEDRVSVVSNFEATAIGSVFPSTPIFGMEFYLNTTLNEGEEDEITSGWYKYNGTNWVKLN